ncbi:hypothetical protein K438DRAFT_1788907 [Mycena galopus ATCC 62051]|nr:hypothetical protein K438DRAFT_1788907 [Mycena galopus ATCC 62051]
MRCLQRWCILLWVVFIGFLTQIRSSPPGSSSSLPQRTERHIRQARDRANAGPYVSPRSQTRPLPRPLAQRQLLRPLVQNPLPRALAPRPNGDVESQRTAHRDAERERQLELQETPSRRRRRIPQNRTDDENRAPSPTPAARRRVEQFLQASGPLRTRSVSLLQTSMPLPSALDANVNDKSANSRQLRKAPTNL